MNEALPCFARAIEGNAGQCTSFAEGKVTH